MAMEEELGMGDRSEVREQERERRRMRDRQRRQSMTEEQRERHLARRRRNYQLRRLRAETSRLDTTITNATLSHEADTTIMASGVVEMVVSDGNQAVNSVPEIGFQGSGLNSGNGFVQGKEKLNVDYLESMNMETLAQKHGSVAKKLRLSQIRCLARSLNRFGGGVAYTCLQHGENDSGRLPGGLRLNRIKRLARARITANNETDGQSHQESAPGRDSSAT